MACSSTEDGPNRIPILVMANARTTAQLSNLESSPHVQNTLALCV